MNHKEKRPSLSQIRIEVSYVTGKTLVHPEGRTVTLLDSGTDDQGDYLTAVLGGLARLADLLKYRV
ncbi:hypothetical protein [Paenibacillus sp. MDMC362]|uniref:hypothetical protein n=1 Tax=Paenibacillus sp. MDMC362 TaxID=2977365 RepID=UPI000DC2A716|nr:hypothetical protein [Paenibacillus sp. MDMC362]RAR41261.1 hypothetical protein DP091_24775 [Paenibacillus sp. MDMC362]